MIQCEKKEGIIPKGSNSKLSKFCLFMFSYLNSVCYPVEEPLGDNEITDKG